ncbi:DNA cytosine methyltransferase [Paucibacter sp. APW11]|uniref:DNA cytosine methyltransferase n=1 Tax=Roseateles aquae TaxID=3077235 RepID=A0ABU3P769_9BURK|nr:DNA cytosine methyltransferase [Paucibacter sp. APW11]MDT8998380.1 DNA cytosine methyltransferase [Paucibacter sp. APW11]
MTPVEIRHFHLFAGLGGGARGFNRGESRVGQLEARFRCIGGIDVDPAAMRDFQRLAGVPGTVLDMFDREQYRAFHGAEPAADWREATPQDIQRAAGGERPHIVFLSAPCKGFSGLLSESKSKTAKYQALNRLTLRGVWLMLEAWADDPPELVLFENVPRLATRGRALLDQITAMLRAYGYATAETTHDCGELGGLAQSRKRFLLVARHIAKVPPLLYEPERRPLRAVGDVLGRMLMPGDLRAGPMHRVPALQWKTWVRLAFVEAGSDWRSLNRLAIEGGQLRDYLIVPSMHNGGLGVHRWEEPTGVIAGASRPGNGSFSVADPRAPDGALQYQNYGVLPWDQPSGTVIGVKSPGQGTYSVADPRLPESSARHTQMFRVVRWDRHSATVTGSQQVGSGAACVADPRNHGADFAKYAVADWQRPAGTVISGSTTGQGAYAVADPRSGMDADRAAYLTGGHYGVMRMDQPAGAVSAAACHDNGRWSVADPRLPESTDNLVAIIRAEDGTWHRPFTTLELAALQSLVDPEEQLELDGLSDQAWRERIGNAVPSDAAQAIASEMGRTLLLAWSGETFQLNAAPVWVRPVAVGLSVAQGA